jgi:Sulfatase
MPGRRFLSAASLAAIVAVVAIAWGPAGSTAAPARPNVVFVLTDDLAWNLVRYMPHVRDMRRRGVTFTRYFVTDSLCCPSRASIFAGRFPHNTRVFTNQPPDGGYQVFRNRRGERSTFATSLRRRGYLTGMMGKYLNGYQSSSLVVPPGWSEWDVGGNAYANFNYNLNENGRLVHHGARPQDYLTDVLAAKGSAFINRAATAGKPFILELATYAPHAPFTPAPRHAGGFPGLTAPRGPAFNAANTNPPGWLAGRSPLRPRAIRKIDNRFRMRAQAVQAVDDLIGTIESTLAARGPRPGRRHLHRVQLGQRLPHGRTPTETGQADRVRHGHSGAPGRGRPEGRARAHHSLACAERRPAPHVQPAGGRQGAEVGRRSQSCAVPPREARQALAPRGPDRASRTRPPRSGSPERQPDDLRGPPAEGRDIRRVPRWRSRVLQPLPRSQPAEQRLQPALEAQAHPAPSHAEAPAALSRSAAVCQGSQVTVGSGQGFGQQSLPAASPPAASPALEPPAQLA